MGQAKLSWVVLCLKDCMGLRLMVNKPKLKPMKQNHFYLKKENLNPFFFFFFQLFYMINDDFVSITYLIMLYFQDFFFLVNATTIERIFESSIIVLHIFHFINGLFSVGVLRRHRDYIDHRITSKSRVFLNFWLCVCNN